MHAQRMLTDGRLAEESGDQNNKGYKSLAEKNQDGRIMRRKPLLPKYFLSIGQTIALYVEQKDINLHGPLSSSPELFFC